MGSLAYLPLALLVFSEALQHAEAPTLSTILYLARWTGTWVGNCSTRAHVKVDIVSSGSWEIGCSDAVSTTTFTAVNSVDSHWLQNVDSSFLPEIDNLKKMNTDIQAVASNPSDWQAYCLRGTSDMAAFAVAFHLDEAYSHASVLLEEGVFMAPKDTAGFAQSGFHCPTVIDVHSRALFCDANKQSFNYICQAAPSTSSPSPSPLLLPSPNPSPLLSPPPAPAPSPALFPPSAPSPTMVTPSPTALSPQNSPAPSPHQMSPLFVAPSPSPYLIPPPVPATLQNGTGSPAGSNAHPSRTTTIAASVGVLGGVTLIAAAGYVWYRKRQRRGTQATPWSAHESNKGADASATLHLETASKMAVDGVFLGDPFLSTTAPRYTWTESNPGSSPFIESGITDTQLDTMSVDGISPALQLSSTEVQQQLELYTCGLLGRGGAALVFKCRWPRRFGNGLLAIKVLKDAFNTSVAVLQSFIYEAKLLSTIRHPHVVRLYGYCLDPPHVCLIMELLPGSLDTLLYQGISAGKESGRHADQDSSVPSYHMPAERIATKTGTSTSISAHALTMVEASAGHPQDASSAVEHCAINIATSKQWTMQEVLQISADIAAALAYLHDRQVPAGLDAEPHSDLQEAVVGSSGESVVVPARVVHRDLKPANVLISSTGRAKLSDFGLAREHACTSIHTMRVNVGTLQYMAPELLALSPTKPTNRVDIYSLGIMMWELLAQRKPWHDAYKAQMVAAVLSGGRPPIPEVMDPQTQAADNAKAVDWSQMLASFSACTELTDLIRECWHQREYRRPAAADVLRRLQGIIGEGHAQAQDGGD